MSSGSSRDVIINNLGILPLGNICSYEEACKVGYSVDRNVELLKRYNYVVTQTFFILSAHIPRTPEWEVKCAISYHLWLDSEHSTSLRKRVSEMRNPPLHLDKIPDEPLFIWLDEAIRAANTLELLVGIYRVIRPEIIRSLKKHIAETNPLVDLPTCRILASVTAEEESMFHWGEQAIAALIHSEEDQLAADRWESHLRSFLLAAGGMPGDLIKPDDHQIPVPRSDGKPYEMDAYPQRDERMTDTYNQFLPAKIFQDETRSYEERALALICSRVREMDVPEYMSPIIYKTKGKPWEYYSDLGRQLFDEARHAMMGEAGLYKEGIPFYEFPLQMVVSAAFNTQMEPLETHAVLWAIEQNLMPKETGKKLEWDIAKLAGNDLITMFQDYDWADEVLHAQIGRKWLTSEFSDTQKLNQFRDDSVQKFIASMEKYLHMSDQENWWPQFMKRIREVS
ncbi:MAG TPA: hypothetical protein VGE40_10945 [Bacilli bacterium]